MNSHKIISQFYAIFFFFCKLLSARRFYKYLLAGDALHMPHISVMNEIIQVHICVNTSENINNAFYIFVHLILRNKHFRFFDFYSCLNLYLENSLRFFTFFGNLLWKLIAVCDKKKLLYLCLKKKLANIW